VFEGTAYRRQCLEKEMENIVGFDALNLDMIFEVGM
jgi:hypothetical protein